MNSRQMLLDAVFDCPSVCLSVTVSLSVRRPCQLRRREKRCLMLGLNVGLAEDDASQCLAADVDICLSRAISSAILVSISSCMSLCNKQTSFCLSLSASVCVCLSVSNVDKIFTVCSNIVKKLEFPTQTVQRVPSAKHTKMFNENALIQNPSN